MKVEEYTALLEKMIKEPDSAGETSKTILENLKNDASAAETSLQTIEAQKATIAKLNADIFTTSTGKVKQGQEEEEKEETPRDRFNRLFDERFYPEEDKQNGSK